MPRRSADTAASSAFRLGLPWAAMTLVLVALHALPGRELDGQDWWMEWRLDLLLHAFLFGIWSVTGLVALRKSGGASAACRQAWPVVVVLGIGLAVGLEWAQSALFAGRGQDVGDGIADVFGLIVGGFAFRALYLEWPVGKRTL